MVSLERTGATSRAFAESVPSIGIFACPIGHDARHDKFVSRAEHQFSSRTTSSAERENTRTLEAVRDTIGTMSESRANCLDAQTDMLRVAGHLPRLSSTAICSHPSKPVFTEGMFRGRTRVSVRYVDACAVASAELRLTTCYEKPSTNHEPRRRAVQSMQGNERTI